MELRHRLAAGLIPRLDLRIALSHPPRQLQPLVAVKARAEQQLEVRIILLEERLQVALHARLSAMQRLQHMLTGGRKSIAALCSRRLRSPNRAAATSTMPQ
jgi:hypothetical protein